MSPRRRRDSEDPGSGRDPGTVPTPISAERIAADLSSRGYHFEYDDDGDITGTWDGHRFWFMLMGQNREVMQVRGRWNGALSSENRMTALQAVNDWNRDRLWPKTYLRDEGELALYAEVSIDFEHGATDAQLADLILCGLVTAAQFFDSADRIIPTLS